MRHFIQVESQRILLVVYVTETAICQATVLFGIIPEAIIALAFSAILRRLYFVVVRSRPFIHSRPITSL